jgi:hypothetical protein
LVVETPGASRAATPNVPRAFCSNAAVRADSAQSRCDSGSIVTIAGFTGQPETRAAATPTIV